MVSMGKIARKAESNYNALIRAGYVPKDILIYCGLIETMAKNWQQFADEYKE